MAAPILKACLLFRRKLKFVLTMMISCPGRGTGGAMTCNQDKSALAQPPPQGGMRSDRICCSQHTAPNALGARPFWTDGDLVRETKDRFPFGSAHNPGTGGGPRGKGGREEFQFPFVIAPGSLPDICGKSLLSGPENAGCRSIVTNIL
jgi:hypothetical protein